MEGEVTWEGTGFALCGKVSLTLMLERNLTSWMQSQEATLGGVLSIQTQPVEECLASSEDYSVWCRTVPAPSSAPHNFSSTHPVSTELNSHAGQTQGLGIIQLLYTKVCF